MGRVTSFTTLDQQASASRSNTGPITDSILQTNEDDIESDTKMQNQEPSDAELIQAGLSFLAEVELKRDRQLASQRESMRKLRAKRKHAIQTETTRANVTAR